MDCVRWCVQVGFVVILLSLEGRTLSFSYHDQDQLSEFLRMISGTYPNITRLYSIGKSVQGRDLFVLIISDKPNSRDLLEPDVKYIANIHGNEIVGRELLMHLIERLVSEYGRNDTITSLVQSVRLHILVSMNPDGYVRALTQPEHHTIARCHGVYGRLNANEFDLNRNFPDYFEPNDAEVQLETQAVINWLRDYQFVLSASLHNGALVVSYPYDSYKGSRNGWSQYSKSMDDDVFMHIARAYANNNAEMYVNQPCEGHAISDRFPGGITNGANWYPLVGGMQDYNYVNAGCMEVTIEVSCCKYPPSHTLEHHWYSHQESLIYFLQKAHIGVKGVVRNNQRRPVKGAQVQVVNRDHPIYTTSRGEYWRLLLPGNYTLKVTATGYFTTFHDFTVIEGPATILNITLSSWSARISSASTLHWLHSSGYDNIPCLLKDQSIKLLLLFTLFVELFICV